ncbi:MAG: S8/S53 family peptidase [Candidatus Obscuribacterales bacterium]|nr:S8/S53 family peptidase [Candidatus Obscuribacterales bacterium]
MSRPGRNADQFKERLKNRGLTIVREVKCKKASFSVFEVQPRSGTANVALKVLQASGDVALDSAELKFKSVFQQCVPTISDPNYPGQSYLQSMKYSEMDCILDAFSVTQVIKPRVTLIDSGIKPIAGELVDVRQFNFYNGAKGVEEAPFDPSPNTHGTSVSSVAASTTNNATFLASASSHDQSVKITMCRTTDGTALNTADIVDAMTWCIDHQSERGGPGVINLSINAAPPNSFNASPVIQGIAKAASKEGDLFVNGAGNFNVLDASKPTKSFRVIVGLDENDHRWVDGVDPNKGSVFGNFEAACPCTNILFLTGGTPTTTSSSTGTSLATPMWSSAIALLMSLNPKLDAPKADKLLLKTGTKTSDGYVKPDLRAAVIGALKLKP